MSNVYFRIQPKRTLCCTLCGREISIGQEYWACNGDFICADCLPVFARQELAPCRETRGKETYHDAF